MIAWCKDIFTQVFDFLYYFISLPILDNISIADIATYGIITIACIRFLVMPITSRGSSLSSSSAGDKPKNKSDNTDGDN